MAALLPPQIWGRTYKCTSSKFPGNADTAGLGTPTIKERIDLASEA